MITSPSTKTVISETYGQVELGAIRGSIAALNAALEMRDPYTSHHHKKVAIVCTHIAKSLNWDEHRVEGLRLAASIHDIGKLSVPVHLLEKPTKLSGDEYALIQKHTQKSHAILQNLVSPWPIAEIVLQHHERLDGTGYPRKLIGDEILLEARVLAVADIIDSMASDRPYRPALGLRRAIEEVEQRAGKDLDREVVHAVIDLQPILLSHEELSFRP